MRVIPAKSTRSQGAEHQVTSGQRGWSENRFCRIPGLSGKSLPLGRLPFVICKMPENRSVLNASESCLKHKTWCRSLCLPRLCKLQSVLENRGTREWGDRSLRRGWQLLLQMDPLPSMSTLGRDTYPGDQAPRRKQPRPEISRVHKSVSPGPGL